VLFQDTGDVASITRTQGKVRQPGQGKLIAARTARTWPPLLVSAKGRDDFVLGPPRGSVRARVLLAGYRASAEQYLKGWRTEMKEHFGSHPAVELVEMSVCDVQVSTF
jgi:hypothetical protein